MGAIGGFKLELSLVALVVLIDQVVKMLVRSSFGLHDSVDVIPGFFNLPRVHNFGAAFGLMSAADFPFKTAVLSAVAALALGSLAWYGASLPADQRLARVGLALVVGGAAGNLIDRLHLGYVVDFIDLRVWPVFNIGGSAITIGVTLLLWQSLARVRQKS